MALLSSDPDQADDLRKVRPVATILAGDLIHVDSDGFNEAVDLLAQKVLEEALMDADLPRIDLDGPREEDADDE
jgi:hypothetical protein